MNRNVQRGVKLITPLSKRRQDLTLRQQYEERVKMRSIFDPIFNTTAKQRVARKYGKEYNLLLGYLDLVSNNVSPYFKGNVGQGIMANLRTLGDTADQAFGASVIKAGIAALQEDKSWGEMIKKAYGVGYGGRYDIDSTRIRENFGWDLGTVGNFALDMAGEVFLDPSTYFTMGASGAAKSVIGSTDEVADLAKVVGNQKVTERLAVMALEDNWDDFLSTFVKAKGTGMKEAEIQKLYTNLSRALKSNDKATRRVFKFLDKLEDTLNKTSLHLAPPYLAFKYGAKPLVKYVGKATIGTVQDYRTKKLFMEFETDDEFLTLRELYLKDPDGLDTEIKNALEKMKRTKAPEDVERFRKLMTIKSYQYDDMLENDERFHDILVTLRLFREGHGFKNVDEVHTLIEELNALLKQNPGLRKIYYGHTEYRGIIRAIDAEITARIKDTSSEISRIKRDIEVLNKRIQKAKSDTTDNILKTWQDEIEKLDEQLEVLKIKKDDLVKGNVSSIPIKSSDKVVDNYHFTEEDLKFLEQLEYVFDEQLVLTSEEIKDIIQRNQDVYKNIEKVLGKDSLTTAIVRRFELNDSTAMSARALRSYQSVFGHSKWLNESDEWLTKGDTHGKILTRISRAKMRKEKLVEILGGDDALKQIDGIDELLNTSRLNFNDIKRKSPELHALIVEQFEGNPEKLASFKSSLLEINKQKWVVETAGTRLIDRINESKKVELQIRNFITSNFDIPKIQREINRLLELEEISMDAIRRESPEIYEMLISVEEFDPGVVNNIQINLDHVNEQIEELLHLSQRSPEMNATLENLRLEKAELERSLKKQQNYDFKPRHTVISYKEEQNRVIELLSEKSKQLAETNGKLFDDKRVDPTIIYEKNRVLQEEVDTLRTEVDQLNREVEIAKANLDRVRNTEVEKAQEEITDLESKIKETRKDISPLRDEKTPAKRAQELRKQYNEANRKLQEMKDSGKHGKNKLAVEESRVNDLYEKLQIEEAKLKRNREHNLKVRTAEQDLNIYKRRLELANQRLNRSLQSESPERLAQREFFQKEYDTLVAKRDDVVLRMHSKSNEINQNIDLVKRNENNINYLNARKERLTNEIKDLYHRRTILESKQGDLPKHNLVQYVPSIKAMGDLRNQLEFLSHLMAVSSNPKNEFVVRMAYLRYFETLFAERKRLSSSLTNAKNLLRKTKEFYDKVLSGKVLGESDADKVVDSIKELTEINRLFRINQTMETLNYISIERKNSTIKDIKELLDNVLAGLPEDEKLLGVKNTLFRYFSYLKFAEADEINDIVMQLRDNPELLINWFGLVEGFVEYSKDAKEVSRRAKKLFDYILSFESRILEPDYEIPEETINEVIRLHHRTMEAIDAIEIPGSTVDIGLKSVTPEKGFISYTFNEMQRKFTDRLPIDSKTNVSNGFNAVLHNPSNIDFDLRDPNTHYVFVDFETTGLVNKFDENNPDALDQIIEAAAQEFHYGPDGQLTHLAQYKPNQSRLIRLNKNKKMSEESIKITGISDKELMDDTLDDLQTAITDIMNMIIGKDPKQTRVFVAHNAKFDWDMLISTLRQLGLYDTYKKDLDRVVVLDTMGIAKMLFSVEEIGSYSEEAIADFLFRFNPDLQKYMDLSDSAMSRLDNNTGLDKLHRANYDVTIGSEMFNEMMERLGQTQFAPSKLSDLTEFKNHSLSKALDDLRIEVDFSGRIQRKRVVDTEAMNKKLYDLSVFKDTLYNKRSGIVMDVIEIVNLVNDIEHIFSFNVTQQMFSFDDLVNLSKQRDIILTEEYTAYMKKLNEQTLSSQDVEDFILYINDRMMKRLGDTGQDITRRRFSDMFRNGSVELDDISHEEEPYLRLAKELRKTRLRVGELRKREISFDAWLNLDGSVKQPVLKYEDVAPDSGKQQFTYDQYIKHLQDRINETLYVNVDTKTGKKVQKVFESGDYATDLILNEMLWLPKDLGKLTFEELYASLTIFFDNIKDYYDPSENKQVQELVDDMRNFFEELSNINDKYNYDRQLLKLYRDRGIAFGYKMKNKNLTNLELNEVVINSPSLDRLYRMLQGKSDDFSEGSVENVIAEAIKNTKEYGLVKEILDEMDEMYESALFLDSLFTPYLGKSNPPISQIYDVLNSVEYHIRRFKINMEAIGKTEIDPDELQQYLYKTVFFGYYEGTKEPFDGWEKIISDIADRAMTKHDRFIVSPDKAFVDKVYVRLRRMLEVMEFHFQPKKDTIGDGGSIVIAGRDDYINQFELKINEAINEIRDVLRKTALENEQFKSRPLAINDVRMTLDEYEGSLVANNSSYVFKFDDVYKGQQRTRRMIYRSTEGNMLDETPLFKKEGSPAMYQEVERTKLYTVYEYFANQLGVSVHEFARHVSYYNKKTYNRIRKINILKRGGHTHIEQTLNELFEQANIQWLKNIDEQKDRMLAAYVDILERTQPELFAKDNVTKQFNSIWGQARQEVDSIYKDINHLMYATRHEFNDVINMFDGNNELIYNYFRNESDYRLVMYQPDNTMKELRLRHPSDIDRLRQMANDGNLITIVNKNDYYELKKHFSKTKQSPFHKWMVTVPKMYSLINSTFLIGNMIEGVAKNVMDGDTRTLWQSFTEANHSYRLWMDHYKTASYADEMFKELGWAAKYQWMDWFYELQPNGTYKTKEIIRTLRDGTNQVIPSKIVSAEEYEIVRRAHEFFLTEAGSGEMQQFSKNAEIFAGTKGKQTKKEPGFLDRVSYNKVIAANFQANSYVEGVSRYAMYLNGVRNGLTPDEAFTKVLDAFFSYGGKSQVELAAEFFIPFISFPMRNYMYFMEALENPAVSKTLARAVETAWGDLEVSDNEYLQYRLESGAMPISKDLMVDTNLGFMEAFTLVGDPFGTAKRKTHPFWKMGRAIAQSIHEQDLEPFQQQLKRMPGISTVVNLKDSLSGIHSSVANMRKPNEALPDVMGSMFSRYYGSNNYKYNRYPRNTVYNSLYTKSGYRRWDLQSQMPNYYNMKYKTQSILYSTSQSQLSIVNKRRSRF